MVRDFALSLLLTVISQILGVPVKDRQRFHRLSRGALAIASHRFPLLAVPALLALLNLVRRLIREKRAVPEDDLISDLIRSEADGDRLDEDELLAMIFLLLIAGHETTVNLIGNSLLTLIRHPEQFERLRQDPDGLGRSAVEELLRHSGPLETATERFAAQPLEYAGQIIPRGEMVFVVLASANRDETQFEQPDGLDLGRQPNRHLSFGFGTHFCLGAPLARLEGQVAMREFVTRFPDARLSGSADLLRWRRGTVLRGLEALPMRV